MLLQKQTIASSFPRRAVQAAFIFFSFLVEIAIKKNGRKKREKAVARNDEVVKEKPFWFAH